MSSIYPIRLLEWDTSFFGQKMGVVNLTPIPGMPLTETVWKITLDDARRQGFRFIYCPIDSRRQGEADILAKSGAFMGDILLTFHLDLKTSVLNLSGKVNPGGVAVREAQERDLPALQEIAADSFVNSRFYQDPRFDKGKASRLYQNWLVESFHKEKILCVQSGSDIVGFVSYGPERAAETLQIRLLAAKSQGRGRGVGAMLISYLTDMATADGYQTLSVGTQLNNYGAVRFYEKMGFRLFIAQYRFHLWLD